MVCYASSYRYCLLDQVKIQVQEWDPVLAVWQWLVHELPQKLIERRASAVYSHSVINCYVNLGILSSQIALTPLPMTSFEVLSLYLYFRYFCLEFNGLKHLLFLNISIRSDTDLGERNINSGR